MQASPAATAVVSLQLFAYMTQFLHTNINRAGIFHLTTSSVVLGLQFRADYSAIRTQQNISRFSSPSVASFSCDTVDALAFSLISQRSSDRHYQSGRPKRNLFKTSYIQVQVAYRGRRQTDPVGGSFLSAPRLSWSRKLKRSGEQSLFVCSNECSSVQMASLQANTLNAGGWFFFYWSCQSFLSLFLLFIHLCIFFPCDLCTVHLLVVVTKPSGYCRKPPRREQAWASHTHWSPFYTRLITSYVCGSIRLTLSLHVAGERTEAGALCCLWTLWKGSSSIYKVLKSPHWGCKDV